MILDRFGQEIKPKIPVLEKNEIATIRKDIDIFVGWINRLENPDPVLRSEAAGKGIRLYDEVDRDAHAGSCLQTRYLSVVGKEWSIVPAESPSKTGRPSSMSKEKVVADFVSNVLENCNFDQARQEILQAILYGFYIVEVLWEKKRGAIVIKKLIGKHPRRFSFTADRELRLLTLQNMIEGDALPERKFIVFQFGDSDNPYGKGIGRKLWWPVWFKKHGIKFWMVFLEKFGMPTVKGKYPPGTLKDQQDKLLEVINAIQTDAGVIVPDSMDIEFIEASRAGTVHYADLCAYMDRQISKAVLGQTATTEGTPGKLGNEKAQGDVRQEITEADADLLDSALNETLIRWIVDFNFPGVVDYPKIVTFAAQKPELTARRDIDKTLAVDIGVPIGNSYFYKTYDIPEPEEGETLVKPAPKTSPFGPSGAPLFAEGDPDWVQTYMDRLAPSLQSTRLAALNDIEDWLRTLPTPPAQNEFIAQVERITGAAFAAVDRKAVADTISEIYRTFRSAEGISAMTGPDIRAINFLAKVDNFYISSFIQNPDAQATVQNFLQERYLEQGAGLFGRGSAEDIQAFRDLYGQTLSDLTDWQVRRIADTSVQRSRNWGSIAQMNEAGIQEIEIYEPTVECDFCRRMNGQVISVPTAYGKMMDQAGMSASQYEADLRAIAPTLDNVGQMVQQGLLPPYHPHCHGIVIRRTR